MIKTLLKQVKQYKFDSIMTPLFSGAEVVVETLIPFVMAKLINKGIEQSNMEAVYCYGGIMIICAIFSLTFGILAGRFGAKAATGFAYNLRDKMYENIQTFSFANIDKFSTPGLVTRLTTDVMNVQNAFQMILRIGVRAPFTLLISMAFAFYINAELTSMFLIAIIILAAGIFGIIFLVMPIFRKMFKKYDDLNMSVQENIAASRVVKAFVRGEYEGKKFDNAINSIYKLSVKAENIIALNSPLMMIIIYGCILFLAYRGAHLIVGGQMEIGDLSALLSYILSMMMSLMMVSMIFVMLTMSVASCERIAEVISEDSTLKNPENPVMEVKDGSVTFEHVNFAYKKGNGKDVLQDINISIRAGETIGIIGGTGSSKTSFVNLISRLYDVTEGVIKVGGVDVRDYDMEVLRNQVSVVLQKNTLFSGSILENLRWGDAEATEEACIRACKLACADEFIQNMPEKYNTHIEQGGSNVSGGQRQRLCIARALLKKPKVLILDDSTSAVDTATDAKIRRAFREEIPDTTKFIIAQRISSVQDADRIIVFENGKINGVGTHEELMKTNAIYQEVYNGQTQGGGDFDEGGAQ